MKNELVQKRGVLTNTIAILGAMVSGIYFGNIYKQCIDKSNEMLRYTENGSK